MLQLAENLAKNHTSKPMGDYLMTKGAWRRVERLSIRYCHFQSIDEERRRKKCDEKTASNNGNTSSVSPALVNCFAHYRSAPCAEDYITGAVRSQIAASPQIKLLTVDVTSATVYW